jgi:hypothetical protein
VASPGDRGHVEPLRKHRHRYLHLADFRADADPQVKITERFDASRPGLHGAV